MSHFHSFTYLHIQSSAGGIGHSHRDLVWMSIRITFMNMNYVDFVCGSSMQTPLVQRPWSVRLQRCRFDDFLFPVETCPGPVISWTDIHGRLPVGPAKCRGSTRNRYASALNPKRPRYICQARPEKSPPVQMLSPLCLHQKI